MKQASAKIGDNKSHHRFGTIRKMLNTWRKCCDCTHFYTTHCSHTCIYFDGKRVRQWYINRSHRTPNDWSFSLYRSKSKQFCPACPRSGQSSRSVFNCSLYRNKRKRWNILLSTNVNAITFSCVIPFISVYQRVSEYPAYKIMNFIFAFMWKVQGIWHYSIRQWWNQVLHHIIIPFNRCSRFFASLRCN